MPKDKTYVKRPRDAFVEDCILRETVRKERQAEKPFTEFQPSLDSLQAATPDKPLVNSFCSRLYTDPDGQALGDVDESLRTSLRAAGGLTEPQGRFSGPVTTNMEYGWDVPGAVRTRSMFNHNRHQTDITLLPSRWEPKQPQVAEVESAKKK